MKRQFANNRASMTGLELVVTQGHVRLAQEIDDGAAVLHAKSLRLDRPEGAVALDRIAALGGTLGHIHMHAVGMELVAFVLEYFDIAEEVEQLMLRLIEPGIGLHRDPGADRK